MMQVCRWGDEVMMWVRSVGARLVKLGVGGAGACMPSKLLIPSQATWFPHRRWLQQLQQWQWWRRLRHAWKHCLSLGKSFISG